MYPNTCHTASLLYVIILWRCFSVVVFSDMANIYKYLWTLIYFDL